MKLSFIGVVSVGSINPSDQSLVLIALKAKENAFYK